MTISRRGFLGALAALLPLSKLAPEVEAPRPPYQTVLEGGSGAAFSMELDPEGSPGDFTVIAELKEFDYEGIIPSGQDLF